MKLVELTEFLVKNLVEDPDSISVKLFEDEEGSIIEVLVSESEIKKVIGKGGATAKAIRTLVSAYSYVNDLGKVRINIDSI